MIYALIPVKDRIEHTLKCIQSLKTQTIEDIKVIVIDDGSVDGTKDILKDKWNDIEIIQGDGNLWCMGAFAKGVDYIRPSLNDNDFVLTQNQDAYFDKNFIQELLNVANSNPNSIVGSINYSGKTNKPIYHNHILVNGGFKPNLISGKLSDVIENTDTLNTRGTLFPASVFKKIGNFSPLFPHYAGDYEITCRAKKNGYKLLIASRAICYSPDENKGLAYRIKEKKKKNLKDVIDLFTSRRSPNNVYYSSLLILLHVPFPQKIIGILRIFAYTSKFIIYDYLLKSVLLRWKD